MRYFICTAANRVYTAGGQPFNFEPVGPRGGSWLGILAVEEPAASVLAAADIAQIGEISEERYMDEKKKLTELTQTSRPSQVPSQRMGNPLIIPGVADRVGSLTPPTSAELEKKPDEQVDGRVLETTDQQPPVDPVLEEQKTNRKTKE